MAVKKQAEGVYLLEDSQAIVTTYNTADYSREKEAGPVVSVALGEGESANIRFWGVNNDLPTKREQLICDNNIVGSMIQTKRDIMLGAGLMAYKKIFKDGKMVKEPVEIPAQSMDFMEATNFDDYLLTASADLLFHSNVFVEFIRNKAKGIKSFQARKCINTRAEKKDQKGAVNHFYVCGKWWRTMKGDSEPIFKIPAYNSRNVQSKFIGHFGDPLLSDGYYHVPAWWGSKKWIILANCIPEFHLNNLKHGYTIRWHIQIPKDYFYQYTSEQQGPENINDLEKNAIEAEKMFLDNLNNFLAGLTNSGRAVITKYTIDRALGKEFPGIKIQPIQFDMKDSALLELFEKSNQANISAQAIHPTLANIETSGKLSSGSEIRNAFLFYIATKTPLQRKILLKPLNWAKKINGWDTSIHFGFSDIELTTLDTEKTGKREVTISDE